MTSGENAPADAALRAEHDALARKLAVRRSVDATRRALYLAFAGLISVGLTLKLAWDRWGVLAPGAVRKVHAGPPLLFLLAAALAVTLLALAARAFRRARALGREEDALFARFRALRDRLRLDP
ncbi:MAG TPA: hypothetical protein VFL83_05180 [Anaeromyxobacter sp.]|nr:hypothetical protein [Anaeromyxobacter sp.]